MRITPYSGQALRSLRSMVERILIKAGVGDSCKLDTVLVRSGQRGFCHRHAVTAA